MDAFDLVDSGGRGLKVGVTSRKLLSLKGLRTFLGLEEATFVFAYASGSCDLFVGWGNATSGLRARRAADRRGVPFILMEDGFVRSIAPESLSGEPPLSVVLDDCGIYYDAAVASRLERLVADCAADAAAMAEAEMFIDGLRYHGVSKYNLHTPLPEPVSDDDSHPFVLVVDQVAGDRSITGAGADARSFSRMIEAALDEAGGRTVVVKLHPETVSGRRRGYLSRLARKYGCRVISGAVDPWELIARADAVYTVSSQLGFEALLGCRPVRCFGMPFFAGWGLTGDDLSCPRRRNVHPSLAALAAAAYLRYARYIDPFDGGRGDARSTVETLALWRSQRAVDDRIAAAIHIAPWKWRDMRRILRRSDNRPVAMALTAWGGIRRARRRGGAIAAWASRVTPALESRCRHAGVPLLRLEDGFIRSAGLGCNFHPALSVVLDHCGIHYDPARESDLENILARASFSPRLVERARSLINMIVGQGVTKYNLGGDDGPAIDWTRAKGRLRILVPGQVESDASVRLGAGRAKDSAALLETVRTLNPDAFIVFRPHPDVVAGHRLGLVGRVAALPFADVYAEGGSISDLMACVDEVHTLTSLTGFEALLRGKTVHCYGTPFYAGWGLTVDYARCPRRTRRLELEELVAGALILYPRYIDPVSGHPCSPERLVRRLIEQVRAPSSGVPLRVRLRVLQGIGWRVLGLQGR